MHVRRMLVALALAAVALPPALAANADGDAGKPADARSAEDADRGDKADKRDTARNGDDLDSCKRDADGMRGPQRSRFMTRCLKERK